MIIAVEKRERGWGGSFYPDITIINGETIILIFTLHIIVSANEKEFFHKPKSVLQFALQNAFWFVQN